MKKLLFLDGLRGYAAVWVLISHGMQMAGVTVPLLSKGGWAVDVFIMMSGFLMTFHYYLRKDREPWEDKRTWYKFWLRRFWRIAPLYYFVLMLSWAIAPYLGQFRLLVSEAYPDFASFDMARYEPVNMANVLAHLTFVFGAIPNYAVTTPLPDWSIGLEAQFYAVFPFLLLLCQRISFVWVAIAMTAANRVIPSFVEFPMPSFLPMKINLFVVGILLAAALVSKMNRRSRMTMVVLAVGISPFSGVDFWHRIFLVFMTLLVTALLFYDKEQDEMGIGGVVGLANSALSSKTATVLAELSYSAYLSICCPCWYWEGYLSSPPFSSAYQGS